VGTRLDSWHWRANDQCLLGMARWDLLGDVEAATMQFRLMVKEITTEPGSVDFQSQTYGVDNALANTISAEQRLLKSDLPSPNRHPGGSLVFAGSSASASYQQPNQASRLARLGSDRCYRKVCFRRATTPISSSNCRGYRDWTPSERAWGGSLCTSTIRPSAPAASAPFASGMT